MFHLLSKQRNKISALASTKETATIIISFPKIIFGFHSYCFRNWLPIRLGGTNHYCDCGIAKNQICLPWTSWKQKPNDGFVLLALNLIQLSSETVAKTLFRFTPVYTATSVFTCNIHFDSLFMKTCCSTSFSFSKYSIQTMLM